MENGVEAVDVIRVWSLSASLCEALKVSRPVYARKVVLAGGRDGSAAPYVPALASQRAESPRRVFHSSDTIDFARFEGGSVGPRGQRLCLRQCRRRPRGPRRQGALFSRRAHLSPCRKSTSRNGQPFRGSSTGFVTSTTILGGRSTRCLPCRRRRPMSRFCAATDIAASRCTSPSRGST